MLDLRSIFNSLVADCVGMARELDGHVVTKKLRQCVDDLTLEEHGRAKE